MRRLLLLSLLLAAMTMSAQRTTSTQRKSSTSTTSARSKANTSKQSAAKRNGTTSTSSSSSLNNGGPSQNLNPVIQKLIKNMVYVEGGTFTMGATPEQGSDAEEDEKPAHQVTLSSFSIGRYLVTQEEWLAVMGDIPFITKGENLPVVKVTWEECQEFIHKLNTLTGKNFRLPTEAEWEYAARGGKQSHGYKYAGSNDLGSVAWYGENFNNQTHPVGKKLPNELGIYDMTGNVWEWCNDWKGPYSATAQTNPQGASSGTYRVCRGGCWTCNTEYYRVTYRDACIPDNRGDYLGFRLVF